MADQTAFHGDLTAEDRDRSMDRKRVLNARLRGRHGIVAWLLLGPGILAMLGENDGPSMLSYAVSGAHYGIGFFLPFILLTFAAAYVVQEMAMRLGAVTHRGYGELIFQRFGPFWGWFSAGDLFLTNLITLVTEIIAIRIGMEFFGISPLVAVSFAVGLVVLGALGSRYSRWERLCMGLALFNLVFVPVAILAKPSPAAIGHAFLTWSPFPKGTTLDFLLVVVSDLGATVTPWMLFFQQSASADKGLSPRDIPNGRLDTLVGTLLAALAGCAALVATGPLFAHHADGALSLGGAGFPQALVPILGKPAAALFALGLIEAGVLAMLTVSASTAYAVAEVAGFAGQGFNLSLWEAPWFHASNIGVALVAGFIVLIPGAPLLAISLNANVIATVLMPPALVFLLIMANDREIMGSRANSRLANVFGILITAFLSVASAGYAVFAFLDTLHKTR